MISSAEFKQIQENRIALYTLVAKMFEKPLSQTDIDTLATTDLMAYDCDDESMNHGLQIMARYLRKRNTGTHEVLNRDYTSAFYGIQNIGGCYAVPYESAYKDSTRPLMGEGRREVFNIYKKQALKLRSGIDLPEDHLAFMSEFLIVMSQRAMAAFDKGDISAVSENLQLQQSFVKEHILSWYDQFSTLANQLVDERFYAGVLEFAGGFFRLDADVLKGLAKDVR